MGAADSVAVSAKSKLLAIAATREDFVTIDGDKFWVREVGALEFAEYGRLLKTDRVKATAMLIAACMLDEPGGNPALTADDALIIAKSARVATPIMAKIMVLSGFKTDSKEEEDDEKESDAN